MHHNTGITLVYIESSKFFFFFKYTVNHYSWVLYLHICRIAYLLKCICNPKINTSSNTVPHIHKLMQNGGKRESLDIHVASWGWTSQYSAFVFQLLQRKQVSFLQSTYCHIFTFLCFLSMISLFKGSPSIMLKCCLYSSAQEGYAMPHKENTYAR